MKLKIFVTLFTMAVFTACTKKCDQEQPTILLENLVSSEYPVRLEIVDPAGNSIFTNNFINPGSKSETLSFPAGVARYRVTVNKNGVYSYVTEEFRFQSCGKYIITVGAGGSLTQAIIKKTN
jgi:hypothetical protein